MNNPDSSITDSDPHGSAAASAKASSARRLNVTRRGAVAGAILSLILLGTFLLLAPAEDGLQVMRNNSEEDLRAIMEITARSYGELVSLITAAFGAVAFLITFQQKSGSVISPKAWATLGAALVLLAAALLLSLLGKELLILMSARNALDLTLPAMTFARWATYGCVVVAAILVSFFAAEVAVDSRP